MPVRVRQQAASALEIATWLEARPEVARVLYPFLPSHPQHDLALSQMTIGGTVVTLDLAVPKGADGKERAFRVMDSLRLFELVNNFADAKSIVTHPASTFHRGLGEEGRKTIGESDATIRLSIGLEDVEDLKDDLARGLSAP
jgi:O-succinylhomoserine sulfhydrylase